MSRPATAAVRLLTGEREPVRLATTANIATVTVGGAARISGLKTIDGVLTDVGDRVLVKDQTDARLNGIYTASAGYWQRAADARTARTIQKGTTVHVQEGTVSAGFAYSFQTQNPVIGVDNIVIRFYLSDDIIGDATDAVEEAGTAIIGDAQAAADIAEGFASDIVSQGNVPIYATRVGLASLTIPAGINNITLNGYASSSDGGGGAYRRVLLADLTDIPSQCYQQDASGAYWLDSDAEPQPQKYGVVNDEHVTDNTTAWNNYFAGMKALGRPVNVKSTLRSKITDTVSLAAYGLISGALASGATINLRNVTFYYSGTRDRVAFKLGATSLQLRQAEVLLPSVIATGSLQWPATLQTGDTAIQIVNSSLSRITESFVNGFTKGIEYVGVNYAQIRAMHINDCKFGRIYTTTGTDGNASFTNENVVYGGRLACSSAANALGNAYGQVFTWNKSASYRGQNNNRFYAPTFEMGQPSGATHRTPVLFDGAGSLNMFERCRVEGAKGPVMICDAGLVSGAGAPQAFYNLFHAQLNLSGGTVQQNNILELNGAVGNRYEGPGCQVHRWSKHDLGKLVKSGGPATAAYLKGRELFVKQGASAVSRVTTSATAIGSHREGIMLSTATRVGVAVDTSKIKTFLFSFNAQSGFSGRPAFYAFDAAGSALTGTITDDPGTVGADDWLTPGELATWGTETYVKGSLVFGQSGPLLSSTPYSTGGDSNTGREVWLSVRNEVQIVHMMVAGATNPAVLRGLEITGYSCMNVPGEAYPTASGLGAMRVYSPVDDDGAIAKASANPASAGGHGYYQAGDLTGSNAAPASGAAALWLCTTTGWLAPGWVLSTAYAVPGQLVTNDTGKIYQLVTAGTSASSGGPTGTGTSITDGTCVWNYIGVKAAFITVNAA